ncbi:phosphoglycerate kinase [Aureimonas fodinaquatilis]|uniref:Phosphoglycerate kinase n=1 Tax=Aureimonas fodinaquatilis TaxID=2565783 RepID=A0A5B0DWM7_9HYPH|nr:phosphoglycerate kinase [Aureimonas fodinaquatilis]KAA0971154.1 phosphoglycerate kinase [Aureimonas fodinaquatilis]
MTPFKTLDDVNFSGKRVLVRVDLNVPMQDGKITDTTRIDRVLPTIQEIADKGGRVILLAHFGRPKGKVDPSQSLQPVAAGLAEKLGRPVGFAEDCVGPVAEGIVANMTNGDVLLLENTRFHPEEEKNDDAFASRLAALGDLYVNEAFSAAHRAHASTEAITRHLPSYAGRTMQAELQALEQGLGNPARPLVAIVGGAKVSSKIDLLSNLVGKVDCLVIGGGMANTFLAALGKNVGKSLCEHDLADTALSILKSAEKSGCVVLLPVDAVVAREFKANATNETVSVDKIPTDSMVLDLGPASVGQINDWISKARTLIWNGPLGAFELTPFDAATVAAARHAAARTRGAHLISVAGGGDTVSALNHAGVAAEFSYVSTAGGAFLEWMEGKPLPGVDALKA